MKKLVAVLLVLVLALSFVACGNKAEVEEPTTENQEGTTEEAKSFEGVKILHLIPNTRGDGGNHDMAAKAIEKMRDTYGAEIKIVELGNTSADVAKYLPTLLDACEEEWDYIVTGTPAMVEPVQNAATEYPEQKILVYDAEVTRENADDYPNVYSALFKQNESSFLAGALATLLSDTGKIGFIGGMEIPVINDFLVGYIAGARYINPDVTVYSAFIGSWNDLAKAKEIANTQYQQGASLIFPAAGQAYSGAFEAGYAAQKMYFGCDVDRSVAYKETTPEMNDYMPTSVLKFVDVALENAFLRILDGENIFGQHETVGLKEGCVGLAKNEYYESIVPEDIRAQIEELEAKVASGEIKVESAFGMDTDQLNAYING